MSESTGSSEADQVEVGPPSAAPEGTDRDSLDSRRPDLDERQRRIPSVRKPMGPAPRRSESRDDARPTVSDQAPTDPS